MSIDENKVDWFGAVEAVRARFSDSMVAQVEGHFKRLRNGRVLIACSGGADSVFLLLQLLAYRDDLGIELVVAHYNHRWRGEASHKDAAFVENLANIFALEYAHATRPENEAAFTETTARALRLDFLRQVASQKQCSCVAFGHQKDDILETQLQRIARGSGTDGLAAPRPIARFPNRPTHVRPLLDMRSVDIRLALNSLGVPWREDASNEDVAIARNALRKRIIPDMHAALDRDPTLGAARSRRLMEEDAAALNDLALAQFPKAFNGKRKLSRSALQQAPRALVRRALMAWLNRHDSLASVGAAAMDLLLDEIFGSKKKHQVSAGSAYIVISEDSVELLLETNQQSELSEQSHIVEVGTSLLLPTGASLGLSLIELDPLVRETICSGQVDPAQEAYFSATQLEQVLVRGWQPGDRFSPIGMPGTKKLQDWFMDRHIPQKERKQLPVVLNEGGEIIWVPGFAPAESMRIRRNTKQALRLTYSNTIPPSHA